jgi:hypothetical protein
MEPDGNSSVALDWGLHLSRPVMARRQNIHAAAGDSKHGQDRLFSMPRRGGGGRRDPRNLCHGNHHHAHHRRSSQHRRARHLLLGTVRARNPCIAVLRRYDRGNLFISSWSRSVRRHRRRFVAGSTTLVAGQFAFSVARFPIVRLVVGLLFALPAACAGYDVTLAFAHIGIPSEWWRAAFAVVGAITVGGTAWARMSIVRNPASREVVLRRSHLSRPCGQRPRAGDSEAPSSVRLESAR